MLFTAYCKEICYKYFVHASYTELASKQVLMFVNVCVQFDFVEACPA